MRWHSAPHSRAAPITTASANKTCSNTSGPFAAAIGAGAATAGAINRAPSQRTSSNSAVAAPSKNG